MSKTTVLFDLDGTLTDPFEGITRSIQYALEKMGPAFRSRTRSGGVSARRFGSPLRCC
ncbi:hypothetical protein [Roseibium aquae]|uniref:hypothetical protein n=1 Tax=Roseibium aquae TaxID=1323746 RepID=UPI00280A8243|nr:hypothetical protein [Roseibium aquae]